MSHDRLSVDELLRESLHESDPWRLQVTTALILLSITRQLERIAEALEEGVIEVCDVERAKVHSEHQGGKLRDK